MLKRPESKYSFSGRLLVPTLCVSFPQKLSLSKIKNLTSSQWFFGSSILGCVLEGVQRGRE